jgi:tetratricopeptide (TPR) repeat protein
VPKGDAMQESRKISGLLATLFIMSVHCAPAYAQQNIPINALRNWMWDIDHGLADLENGASVRAASRFIDAIHEIEPYRWANRRLMARTYCDLARALYQQARYAEAEPLAKWALSVRAADRYARPEAVFQCLFTLGAIDSAQKHYADAEPLFQRALALQELVLPEGDVNTLTTLDALATVLREQGKYSEAERLYLRALAILERIMPDENLDLAYTAEQYAINLRRMNRADEAQSWEARALKIREAVAAEQVRERARADALRHYLHGSK